MTAAPDPRTPDAARGEVVQDINGHKVVYRGHRFVCTRCEARLLQVMQFHSVECPGPKRAPDHQPDAATRESTEITEHSTETTDGSTDAPTREGVSLRTVVEAILTELPMSADGTGHVADCGYDDEHQACGCHSLPVRLARIVAAHEAAALRKAMTALRDQPDADVEVALGGIDWMLGWLRDRADRIEGAR